MTASCVLSHGDSHQILLILILALPSSPYYHSLRSGSYCHMKYDILVINFLSLIWLWLSSLFSKQLLKTSQMHYHFPGFFRPCLMFMALYDLAPAQFTTHIGTYSSLQPLCNNITACNSPNTLSYACLHLCIVVSY